MRSARQLFTASAVWLSALVATLLTGLPAARAALGQEPFVSFEELSGGIALVKAGKAAVLHVHSKEWPGVIRIAGDLQADIERVSNLRPARSDAVPTSGTPVVIGTLGRGGFVDHLVAAGKLDVAGIKGKWDGYMIETVANPFPGVERALVIAGNDKRGTIYGIYHVSEQIGVSPWYWWADVPVKHRDALWVKSGRVAQDAPVVQYRGIFINDEAPALTGWVQEKFGKFDHTFYQHVFELILRLRGNYLWPAMWQPRAFIDDDPENARLADEVGIVIGTTHHEPLMRAHAEWDRYGKGPWDYSKNDAVLREFWHGGVERVKNYEIINSLGMRGDGDSAMSADTNTALLERIVKDQRMILSDVLGEKTAKIPQLWALYKEVQDYYEAGMRVPDDVVLLWCDDNWGNIRRLPTPEERKRPGGAGVYYHFDYVGGPRNYKWLNTFPISKVWEQLNLAWQYDANRIWIVNVGDIKPLEYPIEFFLELAWNPARWPYEKLDDFSKAWGEREFGAEDGAEAGALVDGYTKLNGRRKPEMLAPDTLSLSNYREADRVLAEWADLVTRAEKLNTKLPPEARDAFFQLVLYPVKASAVVQELYVAAGQNLAYVRQGRASANRAATRMRELFEMDQKLVDQYHALGGGRWNHQMDQINLGYTYWQQPPLETAPPVQEVRVREGSALGVAVEGWERPGSQFGPGQNVLPPLHVLSPQSRWIEIFNRGTKPFEYTVEADQPWVKITPSNGTLTQDVRVEFSADWSAVPPGTTTARITIRGNNETFAVQLPVEKNGSKASGFVEIDGHVAIEAPNFSRAVNSDQIEWKTLGGFGRTLGAVTMFPVTAPKQQPGGSSPRLEYDVNLTSTGELTVELHCAPSLNFQSGEGLQLGVSFDDAPPQIIKLDTWSTLQTWEKSVADGVRRVVTKHAITDPGQHVLKFWMVTPGIVLERLIIDAGGVRPSYLGPIESPRVIANK